MPLGRWVHLALASLFLSGSALAQGTELPRLSVNESLRARLPESIRTAGTMTNVSNGSFPPYEIVTGTEMTGASADLAEAIGELLGIRIEHATIGGLPSLLTSINSGRYQFAFGPVGDFKSREAANDFIDWVQEFVVFAVPKGNPKGITSLDTACGKRIAVMAGGSAERVIQTQAERCKTDGMPALEIFSFTDQPSSILAVRARRADAFFSSQAPLTYYVGQANGRLELAGTGQRNGFEALYQGAVVPKGSPLGPILLDGVKILIENGTYAAIMNRWGLGGNMLVEPGINLGGGQSR